MDTAHNAVDIVRGVQTRGLKNHISWMTRLFAYRTIVVIETLPNGNHLDHVISFEEIAVDETLGTVADDEI
jgi:hypothetical protein